jgi:predicted membrane protein
VEAIYIALGTVCILTFGSGIKESVLENIGEKYNGEVSILARLMQILFFFILAFVIPFIFFSGKESILMIIDEIMRRSISYTLSKKLMAKNEESTRISRTSHFDNQQKGNVQKFLEDSYQAVDRGTRAMLDENLPTNMESL